VTVLLCYSVSVTHCTVLSAQFQRALKEVLQCGNKTTA